MKISLFKHVKNMLWIVAEDTKTPTFQGTIIEIFNKMNYFIDTKVTS